MPVDTIPARFMEQGRIRPDSPAYYIRQSGSWRPTTWRDYVGEVRAATRALLSMGIGMGETVCILGFNRPEWVIMDIANMAVGGAPAGIYTTCSAEEVQYILHHAEAPVVLLEDEGPERVTATVLEPLHGVRLGRLKASKRPLVAALHGGEYRHDAQ